jgi:hypothetical protein
MLDTGNNRPATFSTAPTNKQGERETPAFQFSVLITKNLIATKTIYEDGKKDPSRAKLFQFRYRELSLEAFTNALRWLSDQRHCFIIRGKLKEELDASQWHQRLLYSSRRGLATIDDLPRRWIALDFDGAKVLPGLDGPDTLVEAGYYIRDQLLPLTFQQTKCVASVTASTGLKPGKAHLRLFFKLSDPADNNALCQWCEALAKEYQDLNLDPSVLRPIQEIYTARPVFADGCDPVPVDKRVVILDGPAGQVSTSSLLGPASAPPPKRSFPPPQPIPLEEAVPEWLLPLLETDAGLGVTPVDTNPTDKAWNAIARIYDDLKYCSQGERNNSLRKAGWELACLVSEGEMPEAMARDAYFGAAANIPNDDDEYPDDRIQELLDLAFDKVFGRR